MPQLVALITSLASAALAPTSSDTTRDQLMSFSSLARDTDRPPSLLVRFANQRRASYALDRNATADAVDTATVTRTDEMARPFSALWNLPDTTRRRARAIAVSDAYSTRLKIHQIGAFVMLPLVASEFIIGQKLINSQDRSQGLRTAHKAVAIGIGAVFGVNTITGALNWWETRKDPTGRTRRTLHSLLMLASDAGFLWAATSAGGAKRDLSAATHHRAIAEAAISLSVVSTVMMWLWKD